MRDIALLREVQRLSQEQGVNLAGVKRIIELEREVDDLRIRLAELTEELAAVHAAAEQAAAAIHRSYRNELVPVSRQTALVVWKPRKK
jgi:MerR family transcriptional regulator/heat shock protein HspR